MPTRITNTGPAQPAKVESFERKVAPEPLALDSLPDVLLGEVLRKLPTPDQAYVREVNRALRDATDAAPQLSMHTDRLHDVLESAPARDFTTIQAALADLSWEQRAHLKALNLGNSTLTTDEARLLIRQLAESCPNLTSLDLSRCRVLCQLDVSPLKALTSLRLRDTPELRHFVACDLRKLEHLDLGGADGLRRLDGLRNLPALKHLSADHSKLTDVKIEAGALPALQSLDLNDCSVLCNLELDHLPGLVKLDIGGTAVTHLGGLGLLPALQTLKADHTSIGRVGTEMKKLTRLQTLDLSGCKVLTAICAVDWPPALRTLRLAGCTRLSVMELSAHTRGEPGGEMGLPNLHTLDLSKCRSLGALPQPKSLPRLRSLLLLDCEQLTEIPGLAVCRRLEHLDASNCINMAALPTLPKGLKRLTLNGCSGLEHLDGVSEVKQLRELELAGTRMRELKGLSHNYALQRLNVAHSRFKELGDLRPNRHLLEINFEGCEGLQRLPELPVRVRALRGSSLHTLRGTGPLHKLRSLKVLALVGAGHLAELDLAQNTALRSIDVSGCAQLKTLGDLSTLAELGLLKTKGCERLSIGEALAQRLRPSSGGARRADAARSKMIRSFMRR